MSTHTIIGIIKDNAQSPEHREQLYQIALADAIMELDKSKQLLVVQQLNDHCDALKTSRKAAL